jgi:hypothetical protein
MVPGARLMILARDGRATALSMYKRRWMATVRACMDRWGEFAGMTAAALKRCPADRVLVVRYEDLVRNFEEELARVHSFFSLPAPDFDLIRKGDDLMPQPRSLDKWKSEADKADVAYFDGKYGAVMDAFGLK